MSNAPRIDEIEDRVQGLDQLEAIVELPDVTLPATENGGSAGDAGFTFVKNRAPVKGVGQDLKPAFGVERVMLQDIMLLISERSPNSELSVFKPVNDKFDLVRLYGKWETRNDGNGARLITRLSGDSIEVTFYGTGFNLLRIQDSNSRPADLYIDGVLQGGGGTLFAAAGDSEVNNTNNISANAIHPIASGLTLGIHTIRIDDQASGSLNVSGYEVLTEPSSNEITIPAGTVRFRGKSRTSVLTNLSYDGSAEASPFASEEGNDTGDGGRVCIYQKEDGIIEHSVKWNDAGILTRTNADHSEEELVNEHFWREFGSGGGDDFDTLFGSTDSKAFLLDDGTTNLLGLDVEREFTADFDALRVTVNADFWTINFTGTGLDVLRVDTGSFGSDSYEFIVNGVSIGEHVIGGITARRTEKIISGLPYGNHSVRMIRNAAATYAFNTMKFMVYSTKKPAIPAEAVELGSYHLMADFDGSVATSEVRTTAVQQNPTGTMSKGTRREVIVRGTGFANTLDINSSRGFLLGSGTANVIVEYTFFGTGIVPFWDQTGSLRTHNVKIDGVNQTSGTVLTPGTTTNLGSGNYQFASAKIGRVAFTGLTLGVHTIRIENTVGTHRYISNFDVITPTHTSKYNGPLVIRNTLRVGSESISDSRKFDTACCDINTKFRSCRTELLSIQSPAAGADEPINLFLPIHLEKESIVQVNCVVHWEASPNNRTRFFIYVNGEATEGGDANAIENHSAGADKGTSFSRNIRLPAGDHLIYVIVRPNGAGTDFFPEGTIAECTVTS